MQDIKLSYGYTFWVQQIQRSKNQDYRSNLKAVATVQTGHEFWQVFQYLKKSNELDKDCDLYLFKQGIKPEWEDKSNVGGGCFKIKIDKKKSNKLWENAVLSMVSPRNNVAKELNGVRIKIKEKFDQIEIWLSSQIANKARMDKVKAYLKQNLQVTDDKVYNLYPFK